MRPTSPHVSLVLTVVLLSIIVQTSNAIMCQSSATLIKFQTSFEVHATVEIASYDDMYVILGSYNPTRNVSLCLDNTDNYLIDMYGDVSSDFWWTLTIGGSTYKSGSKLELITFNLGDQTISPVLQPHDSVCWSGQKFSLEFDYDFPQQTTFSLYDTLNDFTVLMNEHTMANRTLCLAPSYYLFEIIENSGETFSESGYTIYLDGSVLRRSADFGGLDYFLFETYAPTLPPAISPSAPHDNVEVLNRGIISDCPINEGRLQVNIFPDDRPDQTGWEIFKEDKETGEQISVAHRDGAFSAIVCIADGDYVFVIKDTGGNGLCCENGLGSYMIALDNEVIREGGIFRNSDVHFFKFENKMHVPLKFNEKSTQAPTSAPSLPPAPDTYQQVMCATSQCLLELRIEADWAPEEIRWQISQLEPDMKVVDKGSLGTRAQYCLEAGYYAIDLLDAGGDGLCCNNGPGYWRAYLNGEVIKQNSEFKLHDSVAFDCEQNF